MAVVAVVTVVLWAAEVCMAVGALMAHEEDSTSPTITTMVVALASKEEVVVAILTTREATCTEAAIMAVEEACLAMETIMKEVWAVVAVLAIIVVVKTATVAAEEVT